MATGIKLSVRPEGSEIELTPEQQVVSMLHQFMNAPSKLYVKIERTSRGNNFEISYSGESVDDVLSTIAETRAKLQQLFDLEGTEYGLREVS